MIVLAYAISQFIVFWERSSYTVLNANTENVFTEDEFKMDREKNFAVAAAVWYGSEYVEKNPDTFPDEEIGELKFILKSWGNASGDLEFKELTHRKCTNADFVNPSGGQSEYGFFEMDDTTKDIVIESGYDLRCIDVPYGVKGDFNSNAADNLMVTYELCDRSKRTCKAESVIEEALKYSYILMVENRESYKH